MLGWLARGEAPDGHADLARCGVRCRRRPGRDHARLLHPHADRCGHPRRRRRRAVCPGRRAEVPASASTTASTSWASTSSAVSSAPSRIGFLASKQNSPVRPGPGGRRTVLRWRGGPVVAAGRRCLGGAGLLVRRHLRHRDRHPQDHGLPRRRGRRGAGVDQTEHAESAYDLGPSRRAARDLVPARLAAADATQPAGASA